ncbi:MAG: hypothetical protein B7Z55_05425 [Planctomycetales bacterium 12-60-4]|nr:MAG: hypothetical protein B7Z55_05425 [Planctomycetales bacterium 12-60-4]
MSDAITPQLTFPGASSWPIYVHGGAVLVACLLIWQLIRWERRLVPAHVGWMLLALRLAALGVILLALLKPTWAWVIDRERSGRVVVAIDVSQSMQTSDLHATAAERLRWLTGIGWLGGKTPLPPPPEEPIVDQTVLPPAPDGIDDTTWRELNSRLSQLSRAEVARRTMVEGSNSLWQQLQRLATVQLQAFAGSSITVSEDDVAALVATPPAAVVPDSTRISGLLTASAAGDSQSPLLGIILLTDGRDADATASMSLARSLGQGGVPIFPVIVGSTERPKDLSILSVDTPLAVYRGDKPRIKVMVSTSGFSGQSLDVTLEAVDPNSEFQPQTRTIAAADAPQLLEFDLPAEQLGERKYRLSLPEWVGETRTDNNRREFALQVVDDRTRVLLVDEEPRWEFRYLGPGDHRRCIALTCFGRALAKPRPLRFRTGWDAGPRCREKVASLGDQFPGLTKFAAGDRPSGRDCSRYGCRRPDVARLDVVADSRWRATDLPATGDGRGDESPCVGSVAGGQLGHLRSPQTRRHGVGVWTSGGSGRRGPSDGSSALRTGAGPLDRHRQHVALEVSQRRPVPSSLLGAIGALRRGIEVIGGE